MSYDFEIATSLQPTEACLEEFLASKSGVTTEGSFDPELGNMTVGKVSSSGTMPLFTVDGPFRIDIDDLPESLASSVLAPQWLVQISVPAPSKAELALGKALAEHIAKQCQGAVYDPQQGTIVWPRGRQKRFSPPSQEERIRLVGLEWFLPVSRSSADTARMFLSALRKLCPEAVPQRFGTYEPLQGRMEVGDDEPFLATWNQQSSVRHGGDFFFKSRSPCFGGTIDFPDRRDDFRPEAASRAVRVGLDFDGRALYADPRWSEAIVTLFAGVARALGAFYAAGFVQRNVIAKRSAILFDGQSESGPFPRGRWWCGPPSVPTWLAWFGRPYHDLVAGSIANLQPILSEQGVLLRLGREPLDTDQLRSVFPQLPQNLMAKTDSEGIGIPAEVIPNLE